MAHLVCTEHKKRVHVLSADVIRHRENSIECETTLVKINGKFFNPRRGLKEDLNYQRQRKNSGGEAIDLTRTDEILLDAAETDHYKQYLHTDED